MGGHGDLAQHTALEVIEGLTHLVLTVHHERTGPGDGLAERPAAEEEDFHAAGAGLLVVVGFDGERITGTHHREIAGLDRAPFGADVAAATEDVDEAVELGRPRDDRPGPRCERAVHHGDGAVGRAGAREVAEGAGDDAQDGVGVGGGDDLDQVGFYVLVTGADPLLRPG